MNEQEILESFEAAEAEMETKHFPAYSYCENCGQDTPRRRDGSCRWCETEVK